ncbi:MAG: hypothetical protein K8R92_08005 [Planctomycetes bacterium]|nr:hypothetical protein [Planctomycetota bacterium]
MKTSPRERRQLLQLTSLPTAAGREEAVVAFIEAWISKKSAKLVVKRDDGGNILVMQRAFRKSRRPLLITAHLDHPAFVLRRVINERELELEFRGGVHEPYFKNASIEVIDRKGKRHHAMVTGRLKGTHVFPRYSARLRRAAPTLVPGDIARWRLPKSRIAGGMLHTNACDDLAAAAAAMVTLDRLLKSGKAPHVGLLFTRAEEVGFIGALHSIRSRLVPRRAWLLCLENSRSFPHDSPIGGGAILRVGDRASVFSPRLTNALSLIYAEAKKADPDFKYQRKLMPGGACEATAFSAHGFESTCLCLPLGNYHNMQDIDGVLKGKAKARVGQEIIALDDFAGLIAMLELAATRLKDDDEGTGIPLPQLDALYRKRKFVLASKPSRARR